MKWKVEVLGNSPSEASVEMLVRRTDLTPDSLLMAFGRDGKLVCGGLSETEAQGIADGLKRDAAITCRVFPDTDLKAEPVPLFRVLLVNYRPGYRTRLRRRLQELTRLPQEQVIGWLSRMPFALSKGVDSETARSIRRSVTEAGGIVRIEPETPFQESLSARKKSNAVFRPAGPEAREEEEDVSGPLFRKLPRKDREPSAEEPPVTGLPEGCLAEPPPLDMIETGGGVVMMRPPSRFTAGSPGVCRREGIGHEPPVLPKLSAESVPHVLEFSPPAAPSSESPPVVGSREHSWWADEPAPEVFCLFPPAAGIDTDLLLPPVLQAEERDEKGGSAHRMEAEAVTEEAAVRTVAPAVTEEAAVQTAGIFGDPLRLFLCRPSPEDEDTVAEALRDVMGVSLRESWDLLRKAPLMLREYIDHTSAILAVHQLESRGVTVSLSRRAHEQPSRSDEEGKGIRAWLARNG